MPAPWKMGNPGCECCDVEDDEPPCTTIVQGYVWGCNGMPVPGATVKLIIDAVEEATDTTDAAGFFEMSHAVDVATEATVRVEAFCGYDQEEQVVELACITLNLDFELEPDDDHVCVCSSVWPVAKTLYLTCDGGTCTLTWSVIGTWDGTLSRTADLSTQHETSDVYECECYPGWFFPTQEYNKFTKASGTQTIPIKLWPPGCGSPAVPWKLRAWWGSDWGLTDCGEGDCDWAYVNVEHPFGTYIPTPTEHLIDDADSATIACDDFAASGSFPASFEYGDLVWNCSFESPSATVLCYVTVLNPIGDWSLAS